MRKSLLAVAAILAGIGLVSLGNGLVGTLVSVRLDMAKFSALWIAVVVTGYPLGFLLGCMFARLPIERVGAIRAFAALGGLMTVATLAFTLSDSAVLWTLMRVIEGVCSAVLYTITESWLNARTAPSSRGLVLAVYMINDKLTYAAGQMLMKVADPAGPILFVIGGMAYALCLIPVSLTTYESPLAARAPGLNIVRLYGVSPLGVAATFSSGLINTPVVGLAPIWLANHGFTTDDIVAFMTAMMLGGLALQWPIGWLSDRFDRRRVLFVIAAGTLGLSALLALAGGAPIGVLIALSALFGGLSFAIYPLAVAHANDYVDRTQAVTVSSGLLLSWALGSVAGPPIASALMGFLGPVGLFTHATGFAAVLVGFAFWRMTRRAELPLHRQDALNPE